MMRFGGFCLCFCALLLAASQSAARSLEDIQASGYIEFAVYRDFPPYSQLVDGKPEGIDIDLGKAIAERLALKPRWMWVTADETVDDDLRNAIWKGNVIERRVADVMLRVPYDRRYSYARDGYGLPRNDLVVMLAPYHTESWRIARNLDKIGDVRNLAIFQYQPIGVELDSLPDFFLAGFLGGRLRDNVRHYIRIQQATADLLEGKISAVAGMRTQLEWTLNASGENIDIDSDGLEAMGSLDWDIGIAIRHDFRPLGYRLESVIKALIDEGLVENIFAHYGAGYARPSLYSSAPQNAAN